MPTVPQTQTVFPTVQPQFQSPRGVTPDAFGAAVGRGAEALGQGLEEEAEKDRFRKAKELEAEFRKRKREVLYGTPDSPGFYGLQGQAALDANPAARERVQEIREAMLQDIDDPVVRDELFGPTSADLMEQEFLSMDKTVLRARQVATETVEQARMNEAIQDAVVSGGDPDMIAQGEAIINSSIASLQALNGWDAETAQSRREEAQTLLYRNTIVALLQTNQTTAAKEFFEQHKAKMDAPIAAEVESMLLDSEMVRASQEQADQIMVQFPDDQSGALKAARGISDPLLRDETVKRIERRFLQKARAESQAFDEATSDAFAFVLEGGTFAEWRLNNPEKAATVQTDGTTVANILGAQDMVAEGRLFARTSDGESLDKLRQMERKDLVNVNLETWRHRLTEGEFNEASRMQRSAQDTLDKTSENYGTNKTALSRLKALAPSSLAWDDEKQSQNNKDVQTAIENTMLEWVADFIETEGRKPTFEEMNDKAQELFTPMRSDVFGSATIEDLFISLGLTGEEFAGFVADLSPSERKNFRVAIEDIPPEWEEMWRDELQQRGIKPTELLIEQLHGAEVLQDWDRQEELLGINQPIGEQSRTRGGILQTLTRTAQVNEPSEEEIEGASAEAALETKPVAAEEGAEEAVVPLEVVSEEGGTIAEFVASNEGLSTTMYLDTEGNPTIGVGFNLNREGAREQLEARGYDFDALRAGEGQISEEDAMDLFEADLKEAEEAAKRIVPKFDNLSPGRQAAFIDMAFNLGPAGLAGFDKMLEAVRSGDFEKAAQEAEDSKWFEQVGKRGPIVVEMIRGN